MSTVTVLTASTVLGHTTSATTEVAYAPCDDCGEMFPTAHLHTDDSGSYCDDCTDTYIGQQQALYAPRSAFRLLPSLYCAHGPTCTLGEHCPTL